MSQDDGYIKLSRKFFAHRFWEGKKVFDFADAWLDLIQMASWKDREQQIGYEKIEVPRGSVVASFRYLAKRWSWSTSKIERFLDMLKNETMIETQKKTGITIISLCKYEQYNGAPSPEKTPNETPNETRSRQHRDEEKEVKEGNIGSLNTRARTIPTLEQVIAAATGTMGVPAEVAETWWNEMEGCGWIDRNGRPIVKWQNMLKAYANKWASNEAARVRNHAPAKSFKEQEREREAAIHKQTSKYGI